MFSLEERGLRGDLLTVTPQQHQSVGATVILKWAACLSVAGFRAACFPARVNR